MSTVQEFRTASQTIVELANRDLYEFGAAWAGADPVEFKQAMLEFFPEFVKLHGESSAALAVEYFDELRAEARVGGSFRALMPDPAPMEQASSSAAWAVQPAFDDDWDAALAQLMGASQRLIWQQNREAMRWNTDRDPEAVGWRRETRATACFFCRMLADRGGIYTKESAYFASHDNCQCAVAPSWDRNAPRTRVPDYVVSRRTARMKPEQIAAQRKRIKAWLEANADRLT